MVKYIFSLGRKALISLAELAAVLPEDTNYLSLDREYLVIELPTAIDKPQILMNRLGGSTKIVKVITSTPSNHELPKIISDLAASKFKGRADKVRYALSIDTINGKIDRELKNCLILTKKKLKELNLSSRFINNNFQNPPTALLLGENILGKGAEFVAIEIGSEYLIGETVAIQDINEYSERDFKRPERDARLGMLPPKLAQILINLSGAEPDKDTIYDPFCGVGTILMEATLMGLNAIGSDISEENIRKSRENLNWSFKRSNSKATLRLFAQDSTELSKADLPEKIAAVVSETFLGPPISKTPFPDQIDQNFSQVQGLIFNFLKALRPLIPQNVTVVMTLLCYRTGARFLPMEELHHSFAKVGFEEEAVLPEALAKKFNLTVREKSLIYERPDQVVCREIVKLRAV
jgi:tRNA G10  N-methylase Trm11